MALNSANVDVAVTGALSIAPVGTALPVSASATLNVAFKDLGYIDDNGVTETRDTTSDSIKAWQNAATVRETITEATLTYKAVLIETNAVSVATFYGAPVTTADGSIVIIPGRTGGRFAFVLDVIDGTNLIRTVIAQGEVTDVGDLVYANGSPIGYEITITAYPDSGLGGNAKKYHTQLISS